MADQIDALIKLRRGLDSERRTIIFDTGEIVYSTDNRHTFIGDGNTTGGSLVGNLNTIGTTPNSLAIQNDIYFDKTNCIVYMLSSDVGPESIINYARITPIADEVTLTYNNGKFSINSSYFNSSNTGFVHLAGDTMNGFLTLHHAPTARMHATNMGYVDDGLSALSASIGNRFVHISGDTMQGGLTINATLAVTGTSNFTGDVNFNDKLIKRFTPVIKNITLSNVSDTYTILPSDNGVVLCVDSSSICYIAIPNGLPIGFNMLVIKKSIYTLSFKALSNTNGVQISNVYNYVSMGNKNGVCNMISYDTNKMLISGDLS